MIRILITVCIKTPKIDRANSITWSESSNCLFYALSIACTVNAQHTFAIVTEHPSVDPLPPVGHIWDLMFVWRKGNTNKNLSLCYSIVYYYNGAQRAFLTGRLTVSGFDLAWFSSLSSKCHCVFGFNSVFLMSCMFMFILRSKTRHHS